MNKNIESLSARPKVRNSPLFNEAKVQFEPLNKKTISFIDQNGNKKSIPFISKEFNVKMNSVTYYEPSFDELNKLSPMALHNWIINCRKYEGMLHQLVSMPYFRFWSVISFNREVIASLESYLINATRSYRLHPKMKSIEVRALLSNIHKLVFKVWVRVLLPKESEKNFMQDSYHYGLVRQILDIPKLFSLLQLYGYSSNSEILRVLLKPFISLENALFAEEFTQTCNDITDLFKNYTESGFNLEFLSSLYNFVANVTDIMFTLNKLVLLNSNLSAVYLETGLVKELIAFYASYFLFIENKISDMYKDGQIVENLFKFLHAQLSLTQSSSLLLFHRILQNDLVQRINKENSGKVFDELGDMLNTVMTHKRFCYDFFTKFSFDGEFKPLLDNHELNNQLSMDVIIEFYQSNLKTIISEHLAQTTNKRSNDFSKLISLSYQSEETQSGQQNQQSQQQSPAEPVVPAVVVSPPVNTIRMDKEITAKEQMIKEMFPDFCDGFIYKCLEHYDFDNEKVLDAILECNLPPHLESLSRDLTKNDLLRAQELALQREAEAQSQPTKIAQYDPTSKRDQVPTKIFIGKKDKYSEEMAHKEANKGVTMKLIEKISAEEEDARANVKRLMERGKLTKNDLQTNDEYIGLYDDEFDDTYENEDVSFDAHDETFNDDEEDGDEEGGNQQQQNGVIPGQQRQTSDKFAASQRYNRKQFFNKRNFKRANEPPPTQQQPQQQQHQNQNQNQQRHLQRPQGPAASRQQPPQQHSSNSQHQHPQQPSHHSQHHQHGQQPPRRNNPRGGHSNSNNSHSSNAPNQPTTKPEPKPGPRSHPLPKSEGDTSTGNSSSGNRGGNRNRPRMQGHIRSYHGFSGGGGGGGGGR